MSNRKWVLWVSLIWWALGVICLWMGEIEWTMFACGCAVAHQLVGYVLEAIENTREDDN